METLRESFRWFGPDDPVTLQNIRQCGCSGVFTSLHHIPYGEAWPRAEIAARKATLAAHGLEWFAVESVPVSEDIRTRTGDYRRHIDNYKETVRNLGAEAVPTVVYNFMPVLDWVRTDLRHRLPDGRECLRFDPARFAAFELFLLKRSGAEADYTDRQIERAENFFRSLDRDEIEDFERSILDVFPGVKLGLGIEDIRTMLAPYRGIDAAGLKEHLRAFLAEVIPVCEESGVVMAVHPDDPPRPILGLPRIVSTEADLRDLTGMVDSDANGICFCTGSLGVRPDNDLPGMVERHGHRMHAFHFRSTQREEDGSFFEADHLGGSVDMFAVLRAVVLEMRERARDGRPDRHPPYRPDHGHVMLDDLGKPPAPNPGYSCIGRMRGLAELRGLRLGIERSLDLP